MRALVQAADWLRALSGWRRQAVAFLMGLVSALAFAPLDIFPALLIAYAVLILLLDGAIAGRRPILHAAFAGWAFGFGQFLAGLYWVGYAFMVDAANYAWMLPFVVALLPGGLALFPAGASALSARLWRPGAARVLIFAIIYALAEWLRGHVFTGFPWNLAGYSWGALPGILQSASVFGAYGLTFLTLLLGASLAQFGSRDARAWRLPAALIILFVVIWGMGAVRLAVNPQRNVAGTHLRIVQPNVPQQEKFARPYIERNWARLMQLSIAKGAKTQNIIIWPEAAPPFLLARQSQALDDISILTGTNRTLITGSERGEIDADNKIRFRNSVYVFANGGKLLATYDKFHLVPFGEYLPAQDFLESLGIMKIVGGRGGFTPGDGPHTFEVSGAPSFGPLICYEIIFPGAVVGEKRPQWFVNVTDDSWFGSSSGPYQHLLIARVRAIEEGIPVARAANTGVSAIIDPLGRVDAELGLNELGVLDGDLPEALSPTLYARFGDLGFFLMLFIFAGFAWRLATSGGRSRE